jgi:hypothetical protein
MVQRKAPVSNIIQKGKERSLTCFVVAVLNTCGIEAAFTKMAATTPSISISNALILKTLSP